MSALPGQLGFCFDVEPPSPARPVVVPVRADPRQITDAAEFTAAAVAVLPGLPDDICIDDVLTVLGFPSHSIVAWHRSRVIDALIGPGGEWVSYSTNPGIRFRRKVRA